MDNIEAVKVFINEIASQPGNDSPHAIWPCILTTLFTSSNNGSLTPLIYTRAISSHTTNPSARRIILQRMKESLIKGAMIFGLPLCLNAFYPLAKVISEEDCGGMEVDLSRVDLGRAFQGSVGSVAERGMRYFRNLYRGDVEGILGPMERLFPELSVLTVQIEYGLYLSDTTILSPIETSIVTIASLLPLDVPTQVKWHMRGLLRNGGTLKQVEETLEMCERVCRLLGVELKHGVPRVEELGEGLVP